MESNGVIPWYSPGRRSLGLDVLRIVGLTLAYISAQQIAFFFPDSGKNVMLIWPASGVGLAAFLLIPRRLWPALTLAFYVSGIVANVLLTDRSLMTGAGYMTGNMIESIGCAWLILYVAGDFRNFTRVKEILALIAGAVVVNGFSGCIGAGVSVLTRGASFTESWQSWFISDGLGILLVGPFIVVWLGVKEAITGLRLNKVIEGMAITAIWVLINLFIFRSSSINNQTMFPTFILAGLLVWVALWLGQRGVTLALILLFVIAIGSPPILHGPSPWVGPDTDLSQRLAKLQLFLGMMAVIGYLMAAGQADRRRALDDLRESEGRYRLLAENSTDMISRHDAQGVYLYASPACRALLGYEPEELIGHSAFEFIHPDDSSSIGQSRSCFIEQPIISTTIYRIRCKNGGYIWLETISRTITEKETGVALEIHAASRDITERRRAEETLRREAALLAALTNSTDEGILVVDGQGKKVFQNRRAVELWQIPQPIADSDDDQAELQHVMHLTKQPERFIEKVTHLYSHPDETSQDEIELTDRTVLDRYSAPVLGKDGENYGRIWTFRDITEQRRISAELIESEARIKALLAESERSRRALLSILEDERRAQEDLRKSEDRFRSIFENIQDVYYETAIDGTILEVSPSIEVLSKNQYQRHDLLGRSINDFYFIAGDRQLLLDLLKERGIVTDYEIDLKNRDGAHLPCSISAKIQFDAQGAPLKIIGSIRDITERKRAETALLERESLYRQLFEMESDALLWVDVETLRILDANAAAETLYGYSHAELLEMRNPDLSTEPEQTIEAMTERLTNLPYRLHRKKDGEVFPVEITISFFTWRNRHVCLAALRDITGRKRAEEDLHRQFRLQELLMNMAMTYINLPPEAVELAIRVSLKELGEFVGAMRSYVFDYDFQAEELHATHEWYREGLMPAIAWYQAVSLAALPDWGRGHAPQRGADLDPQGMRPAAREAEGHDRTEWLRLPADRALHERGRVHRLCRL